MRLQFHLDVDLCLGLLQAYHESQSSLEKIIGRIGAGKEEDQVIDGLTLKETIGLSLQGLSMTEDRTVGNGCQESADSAACNIDISEKI